MAKEKKKYFTQIHEDAIIEFVNTSSRETKDKLYRELIGPVLEELIRKIVFTYRFTNLANVNDLMYECLIYLIEILHKFDPSKGHSAFTYFTVVTRNWFFAKIKKQTKRNKIEGSFEDLGSIAEEKEGLVVENTYVKDRERKEFFEALMCQIDKWCDELGPKKENEKKILMAVKILFKSKNDLEILHKKMVYQYIRNITGLNSKQVISGFSKIRRKYQEFVKEWKNKDF